MNQAKIIEQAVLSVDENYLKERYPGNPYIPVGLYYGDSLTERYKKTVRRVCGSEYPGGDIGMVIDFSLFHTFSSGYLFTDKGFYPTKGRLGVNPGSKKRGIFPLEYVNITSIEVVKKYDDYNYIRITTLDDDEMIGFANIYAPYICEVIKKIMHDLWGRPIRPTPYQEKKQKQAKQKAAKATKATKPAEPAPAPSPQKAPAKPAPATITIDDLWEEAQALSPVENKPVKQTAPKKEMPPVKETPPPEKKQSAKPPATKLTYKSQLIMISDGSADHKAAALCQWLQKALNPGLYQVTGFTSTEEAKKALLESPVIDHLLIYTDIIQFHYSKLKSQLSGLTLAKNAKILVYLDSSSLDDSEVMELIEHDITELCDELELSENKLVFVQCYEPNAEDSYRDFLHTLQWECLDRYRHNMPFRMPVDRVFHIKKEDGQAIQVVGGQVLQGSIQAGETVYLVDADGAPQGTVDRILDPWKKEVDIALPGMNVDLLLTGIPREAVLSGKIAATENDGIKIEDQFSGKVYAYKRAEGGGPTPLYEGLHCSVTVGSAQCLAVITQIHTDDHMLSQGVFGYIDLQTAIPLPMEAGMTFRMHNDEKCIAAGHIYLAR